MKKICVMGHYGFGKALLNGQTIKTKIITEELQRHFGENEITTFDTGRGKKTILLYPYYICKILKSHHNVIMLPARKGLMVISPLLAIENKMFKRQLHYVVIGGWLSEYLDQHKWLKGFLSTFNGIYVETNTMKSALEKQGLMNVYVMPNCKKLRILDESELVYSASEPLKLCTFSRVTQKKGIEDAIAAVKAANKRIGRNAYNLDIYGQIDTQEKGWFDQLKKDFPKYIKYKGEVPFDKSVDVLKEYYALLFLTRYYTEGIPGTIIDAYAAGIPVIASSWENFSEVVDNEITGLGYHFSDNNDLVELLINISANPGYLQKFKMNCLAKAKEFAPESSMYILLESIIGNNLKTSL